jgi:hypothetical protein
METKLTLRLQKKVIDQAKEYADDHDISLSKLVENYLLAITEESGSTENISPLVKSLSGVIQLQGSEDLKRDYHKHLDEKYL